MKLSNKSITGIILIVVGVLFIVMKGEVIGLAMTLIGVAAIVMGIVDLSKSDRKNGVLKIVIGSAVIVFGWLFVSLVLYAIAAVLIIYSVGNLVSCLKTDGYPMSFVQALRSYAKPIAGLIGGILLLFNQGGTVSWVFVLCGIVLIVQGALTLSESGR